VRMCKECARLAVSSKNAGGALACATFLTLMAQGGSTFVGSLACNSVKVWKSRYDNSRTRHFEPAECFMNESTLHRPAMDYVNSWLLRLIERWFYAPPMHKFYTIDDNACHQESAGIIFPARTCCHETLLPPWLFRSASTSFCNAARSAKMSVAFDAHDTLRLLPILGCLKSDDTGL
jgi:hypothetical protein